MTDLSNIFFGKKVVQKAYLNNALIYQSNGWETLPSTCSEVWTKNYEHVGSFNSIAKDSEDNIYIGASNTLYKIGPDGDLKWKAKVKAVVNDVRQVTGIAITPKYIYCSYFENGSSLNGYVSKLDKNGNLISSTNVNTIISDISDAYFVDMKSDSNNIYAITSRYIIKLDLDLKLIEYASIPYTAYRLAVDNGSYVFVGTEKYGTRFSKDNLKNSINLIGNTSTIVTMTSITLDSIGHVYFGCSGYYYLYKYDTKDCQLLETKYLGTVDSRLYDINSDTQDNLYVIYYNGTNYLLRKYSSDGTLIWDNVQIPTAYSYSKVITDSNNNIYVCYMDSNANLTIKKLVNLIKKGS